MGATYTIQIREEKSVDQVFYQNANEEQEYSWVASSNFPGEAMVVKGGDPGGSVEDREEEGEVDSHTSQHHSIGASVEVDGDVSLEVVGKRQPTTFVSENKEDDFLCKVGQKEIGGGSFDGVEVASGEFQGEKETVGVMMLENGEEMTILKEKCHMGDKGMGSSGPVKLQYLPCGNQNRSFFRKQNVGGTRTRSCSLPPYRIGFDGPIIDLGLDVDDGLEASDSISLVESNCVEVGLGSKNDPDYVDLGARVADDRKVASDLQGGLNLEVVLPGSVSTPNSGLDLLVDEDAGDDIRFGSQEASDANKLLLIQKNVGFCYEEPDGNVIKVLTDDEQRDRLKKQEWEERNGYQ
ncbi:hypothetical protein A2U01_0005496 [Trifolium medium]|uniref:Uncharacterized protein n=1 Tax=Trifolium medium TaxID=97028 RepID=A0A392MBL2_9FABA|nr:hypothetical protein [Trifolium medium]